MKLHSRLLLKKVEFDIHLGCFDAESRNKQPIWVEFDIIFKNLPGACQSDSLNETICYATLSDAVGNFLHNKAFKTLEALAAAIFITVKPLTTPQSSLRIGVTKHPTLNFPNESATFWYGEH
jgi:dihydroneopterin aldolase